MNILSIYVEAFYRYIHPRHNVHIYLGVTNESIAQYKHNILTHPGPGSKLSIHVFIMSTLRRPENEFVMYTFVRGIDFGRVLTAVRLPHNHRVYFLYVADHHMHLKRLIGDDYVVHSTLTSINEYLSSTNILAVRWLNEIHDQKCVLGTLTKERVLDLLYADPTVNVHLRREYYRDMSIFTSFTSTLLTESSEFDNALVNQLASLTAKRADYNPTVFTDVSKLTLPESAINLMMNIPKVCFKLTDADEIIKVTPSASVLADAINTAIDAI